MMKKVSIAFMSVLLVLGLVGCGSGNNLREDVNKDVNMGAKSLMNNTNSTADRYDHKMNMKKHDTREHQSMLTQHIRNVEGVTDSTLLVDNNDIIVGIDVANGADRKKVEENVRKLLLKDQNGQNVHVTSDSAFHKRIRDLGQQMSQTDGNVLTNVTNDIKILMEDIGKSINKAVK